MPEACEEQSIVIGMGCDRGVSQATLQTALDQALEYTGHSCSCIRMVASIDLKNDEASLLSLAHQHHWKLKFFSATELSTVEVPNPSEVVRRHTGAPAVAEAAAILAAGGTQKDLLLEKHKYRGPDGKNATVSVARMRSV